MYITELGKQLSRQLARRVQRLALTALALDEIVDNYGGHWSPPSPIPLLLGLLLHLLVAVVADW